MISLKEIVEKIEQVKAEVWCHVPESKEARIRIYMTQRAYDWLLDVEGSVKFELTATKEGELRRIYGCPVHIVGERDYHPAFTVAVTY